MSYNNWCCCINYLLARTLHHPNILTFIGIIQEKSRITILTNYVVGKNLFELLHDPEKKVQTIPPKIMLVKKFFGV